MLAADAGRYRLYAARSCPFAHRVRLVMSLLGMRPGSVHISYTSGQTAEDGFYFEPPEPLFGETFLRGVYSKSAENYEGKFTTPLLVDAKTGGMVDNDSISLMWKIFEDLGPEFKTENQIDLVPDGRREDIESLCREIAKEVPLLPYKYIFAPGTPEKDAIKRRMHEVLTEWDVLLSTKKFVAGESPTLADCVLWPCLIRFDNVYARQFGLSGRTIREDYPHIQRYLCVFYDLRGAGSDLRMREVIREYWQSGKISRRAGNDPLSHVPEPIEFL